MNWKQENIKSADAIPDFLERHLAAAGITSPNVIFDFGKGYSYELVCRSVSDEIMHVYGSQVDDMLEITGIEVAQAFRGRHLGALLYKCALAICSTRRCNLLEFYSVRDNGLSFHPRYGALPNNNQIMPQQITAFLQDYSEHITPVMQQELEEIRAISHKFPLRATRILSQSDLRLSDGTLVCAVLLSQLTPGGQHYLAPGDAETRKILEQRLGAIPSFRAPDPDGVFSRLLRRLHPKPTIPVGVGA